MDARSSFSVASADYVKGRPTYPPELFAWIASSCSSRQAAWDCATGNGQAAVRLAETFASVEATDISMEQLQHGFRAANLRYSTQAAERTDFHDASFDLVAVAQALHWFDYDGFWPEVRRVARPGAFFCAWGYSWFEADPELHELGPLLEVLEPYWAPNNRILWNGYSSEDVRFPFQRVQAPAFSIKLDWTLAEVVNYLRTWSAYKRAIADGRDAGTIARLENDVLERAALGEAVAINMPMTIVAGPIS